MDIRIGQIKDGEKLEELIKLLPDLREIVKEWKEKKEYEKK